MTTNQLKAWVCNSRFDTQHHVGGSETCVAIDRDYDVRPTRVVEIIDEALAVPQLQSLESSRVQGDTIGEFCGVKHAAHFYTLNLLQDAAFGIIATHLLRRWRGCDTSVGELVPEEYLQEQQLLFYLGGEGGTGKSRVINALVHFCRSWQRPDAIMITAMTGKAASIIGGCTLASFETALRAIRRHSAFQDLDCVVVDEVSMMSKSQLIRLDQRLRVVKGVSNVPFGGVHVVLVGDFLQLPPVRADPIFIDPEDMVSPLPVDTEGFQLWRQFNRAIVLQESVRFRADPAWGEGCSKARYGVWTDEFVNMINSRLVTSNAESFPAQTIFVTPDNNTRTAINAHFIQATSTLTNKLPVRVVANFRGALGNLSAADIATVFGQPDTKFGRMAPYLDCIDGMPIQITQNIRTRKGVANGTLGVLRKLHFPDGTTFTKMTDRRMGCEILIPSHPPLYALVELNRGDDAEPICDGMPPAMFPVFPDARPFSKSKIQLTPTSSRQKRTLEIRLQQFPFVCSVGATIYKVQGDSLTALVVVDWKTSGGCINKPQQPYLMVSRVVKRDAISTLKPFTPELASWARPPISAIAEDRRLRDLSIATLSWIQELDAR